MLSKPEKSGMINGFPFLFSEIRLGAAPDRILQIRNTGMQHLALAAPVEKSSLLGDKLTAAL